MGQHLFTSESVTEGHPDKIADQISDGVLDAVLTDDPMGRVACETLITTGQVIVAGEISTSTYVDIPSIVRATVRRIGYTRAKYGFDSETCGVSVSLDEQSPDIAQGVDSAYETRGGGAAGGDRYDLQGAGDQGLMFGYATDETPELMPLPITLAHRICQALAEARRGELGYLRPDGKSQVTVRYVDGVPTEVVSVVLSTQHAPEIGYEELREDGITKVIRPVLESFDMWHDDINFFINPTGIFVVGGPLGDAGLTGRKIIVDTYGGMARHGGGAFSGKDATKVDRSAAYFCRWVARQIVQAGITNRVELQVAYAIGHAEPVSLSVETFGTGNAREAESFANRFDFRPGAIIDTLGLRRPIFSSSTNYGHFGRPGLPWEPTTSLQA